MKAWLPIFLAGTLSAAGATVEVAAPDSVRLADVTVTAIKQTSLNSDAGAATVLHRDQVERNDAVSVKAATAMMPGVFQPDYGSRMTSTLYVRGIGTRIDQPAVGLNVDNVPVVCKESYDTDLPDIALVEMLRGPQSTLYGRNTLGGVMNIYTLSPLNWQGTRAVVRAASHGTYRIGASHYTRLGDRVAASATAYCGGTAGEFRNQCNGQRTDWERLATARVKLEWQPDATLLLSNVLATGHTRQGGYPYEQVNTDVIAYNDTCFYRRTTVSDGLTLTKHWERVSLSSITSYQYIDDNMTLDQDFTAQPYFTLTQARREHAVTQDVVVRGRSEQLQGSWLAGAFGYYRHTRMDAPVTFKDTGIAQLIERHVNDALPAYPVVWDTREFVLGSHFTLPTAGAALYAQASRSWRRLTVTAGLRLDYEYARLRYRSTTHTGYDIMQAATATVYRHEPIDIDDSGTLTKHFVQLLPRLTATLHLGGSTHVADLYATVARGSKAGGFNTQMFSDVLQQRLMRLMGIGGTYDVADVVGYRPEKAWNLEVGTHLEVWQRRLAIDASFYWMDCRDRQLTVFPPGLTTGRMMTNAGRTRHCGLELALQVHPADGTTVHASYGYTHATFRQYNDGKTDYAGCHVPYAPLHTLWAEAAHTITLSRTGCLRALTLAANVSGAGCVYWNEANTLAQPFYALMGASVTIEGRHCDLQLWGRNLTGTTYRTFYFVSIGHEFLQRGHGRTLGATLRLHL
ncbi:MAG: TonB-dependent receptor plug domain-containing protein [Muribaculaceae bacterium]|nr:TonB-dependent receptor plug domain-containing protein [Muribaculaceae bacterium]